MRRVSAWLGARSAPVVAACSSPPPGSRTRSSGRRSRTGAGSPTATCGTAPGWPSPSGTATGPRCTRHPPSSTHRPGFDFLLAPVMVVGHALGLATTSAEGTSYKAFGLILAPVATLMAGSVLFALDAIARSWGLSEARRLALALVAGLGVVSAAVFWVIPRTASRWRSCCGPPWPSTGTGGTGLRRAAWLLGVAVACQPLALLAVAPIVARFGWGGLRGAVLPLALPTAVVVLPELVVSKARTLHAVVDQPYLPAGESSTPFGHFARALGHGMYSGGTLRLVATVAAVALGCALCRRRHDLPTVLFAMSLAFTLRVVLESELLGFYFFPVVALSLLLTLRGRNWSPFVARRPCRSSASPSGTAAPTTSSCGGRPSWRRRSPWSGWRTASADAARLPPQTWPVIWRLSRPTPWSCPAGPCRRRADSRRARTRASRRSCTTRTTWPGRARRWSRS